MPEAAVAAITNPFPRQGLPESAKTVPCERKALKNLGA
jgi:hypothetical protein